MHRVTAVRAAALVACLQIATLADPRFAGTAGAQDENAVWKLLHGPVDPPQMRGHAAVHDRVRHRMVLVNGQNPRDVWVLTLPASGSPHWERIPVPGPVYPPPRILFAAVHDPARNRVVLFGGRQGILSLNDVWSLSLSDEPRWEQLVPEGDPPSPRDQTAAIFDPLRDRMVVFGGIVNADYSGQQFYSETWTLEFAGTPRWTRLEPLGTAPAKRKGAGAVYDPWGDRMIVFGGWAVVPYPSPAPPYWTQGWAYDDTWALSLSGTPAWQRIQTPTAPPGRQEHVTILDPVRREMIVRGGNYAQWAHTMDDTWTLPLDAGATPGWARMATVGSIPSTDQHSAIYSPERGSLIEFGGEGVANECAELGLATHAWSRINSDAPGPFPSRRGFSTLVTGLDAHRLLLWGGASWGCQHDLWEFALEGQPGWSVLPTTGIAPACWSYNFVCDTARRRLLCIAGESVRGRGTLDQVWALPFDEPRVWTRLETRGPNPPPRFEYGLAYDSSRDRVLLFGGCTWQTRAQNQADDWDDLWELALDDLTWTRLAPVNSPGARRRPSVHYDAVEDRLIVVGGATSSYRSSTSRPDCWALALGADSLRWSRFAPDLPPPGHLPYEAPPQQAVLDPLRNRLLLWNGATAAWTLSLDDPQAWNPLVLSGEPPVARSHFSVIYDAAGDQLIVHGGYGPFMGDLQALRFSEEVAVDVRPRERDGVLPIRGHGLIEAAILGSASFSVDSILPATVTLAGAHAFDAGRGRGHFDLRDVNGDGRVDLELRFAADSMRVGSRDTVVRLWGETPRFGIRGLARIRAVPANDRPGPHVRLPSNGGVLRLSVVSPGRSGLVIHYSLASAEAARIEAFDVSGRRVLDRGLTALGPGDHHLRLERGWLPPGLYLLRLSQGSRRMNARAVLLD